MSYAERNIWVQLIAAVVVFGVYGVLLAGMWRGGPPEGPDWIWAMVWTVGGGIALSIVGSVVWNIAVGIRRGPDTQMDERDREISHISDRVGQAFLVIAGLAALIMCAMTAPYFWIAQVLFAGFAISALVSAITSVILYRTGTR